MWPHQPGMYIDHNDWHKTPSGKEYFASILRHGKRRTFGCLESPMLSMHLLQPQGPQVITYKLCLVGKTAVGKSSTVAKLCGQPVPSTHAETPGIVSSIAFWPALLKESGKPVMFRLQFCDAGHSVQRKFDHITPACRENAHAILYFFSFTDRSSFDDISKQLASLPAPNSEEETALRLVIGTKYDQYNRSEITSLELRDFQNRFRTPVLKVKNTVKPMDTNALLAGESSKEIDDVAPTMNALVEYLWTHEQAQAGKVLSTSLSPPRSAESSFRSEPAPGDHVGPSSQSHSRGSAIYDEDDDDDGEATYV